jgi:hypothetical protein
MITAYHGTTDYRAAEFLAVNPFAPLVQTAARLWGCDRLPRPRRVCRHAVQGHAHRPSLTENDESLSGRE